MGRDTRILQIDGLVSRHNSHQDRIDDALWQGFIHEVDDVIKRFNRKYPDFSLEVIRVDDWKDNWYE